ncbi:MAG: recombination mediator RecR, partial [Verrucomicrobiota bacterium]
MLLPAMEKLVKAFGRLPGVGRRSAERMAYKVALDRGTLANQILESLKDVKDHVTGCALCGSLTLKTEDPCGLCTDPRRDERVLCVVEDPSDIITVEQSGGFRGRYHALMGKISPIEGEGINDLRIQPLLKRLQTEGIEEIILALNSNVESDATASYLQDVLQSSSVKVTRIA